MEEILFSEADVAMIKKAVLRMRRRVLKIMIMIIETFVLLIVVGMIMVTMLMVVKHNNNVKIVVMKAYVYIQIDKCRWS